MKIPDTVCVMAQRYRVVWDQTQAGRGNFGERDASRLEIRLDPDVPASRKDGVFLHELFEAMNYELDIGLKHHQIELLEAGLYQVLMTNPGIMDYEVAEK